MKTYYLLIHPSASATFANHNNMVGNATIPDFNHLRPNYNMEMPIQNVIPMSQNAFRYPLPFPTEPFLLPQFQSPQIGVPIPFGGIPANGYLAPQGPFFMRPGNFPFLDPPIEQSLFFQPSTVIPKQPNPSDQQGADLFVTNPTSHPENSFQDSNFQNYLDVHPAIKCPNMSEQQAKANTNLELASQLSTTTKPISNLTEITTAPPATSEELKFLTTDDDFPPLN